MLKEGLRVLHSLNTKLKFSLSGFRAQPNKSKLEIVEKKKINHDCYIYSLKWADTPFFLSIGQHFRIVETIPTFQAPDGEEVIRKYTPISPCSQKDIIDLLIKVYRPNVHPKFPQGGKITPYLEKLEIGDKINIDGPFGRFDYKQGGRILIEGKQMQKKRIFFMAGGSGITPIYQTIQEIIKMNDEKIEMIVLVANKSEEDIVLRKEMEEWQPRVKVHFILDTPPQDWQGFKGFATQEVLEKICPLDDPDTLYVHCGPGPMNMMIREIFTKNFPKSTLFKY